MTDPITLESLMEKADNLSDAVYRDVAPGELTSARRSLRADLATLIAERDAMRDALQALVSRYEFDGIPNDSRAAVDAARALLKEPDHV